MVSFKHFRILLGCTAIVFGSEFDRRAACNGDNCLRALSGIHPGSSDCSSYFLTTVSGTNTIIPTYTPTYASACSGAARYSSACSCIGVTGSTTTFGGTSSTSVATSSTTSITSGCTPSTVTSTVTVTATVSVAAPPSTITLSASTVTVTAAASTITDDITITNEVTITPAASTITDTITDTTTNTVPAAMPTTCDPGGPQPTFALLVVGSPANGDYGSLTNNGGNDFIEFVVGNSSASLFTFNDACNLVGVIGGEIANVNQGSSPVDEESLFFNTAAQILSGKYVEAICDFLDGQLLCNARGGTLFEYCPLAHVFITTTVDSDCEQIQLEGEFS